MVEQLVGGVVLVSAAVSWGWVLTGVIGRRLELHTGTTAGLVPLLGVAAIGVITFLAGHVGLLIEALPWLLFLTGIGAAALTWRSHRDLVVELSTAVKRSWSEYPVLLSLLFGAVALALVAGLAEPFRTDEVEYHWPAPLAWAKAGAWNASPYRHVNAFPFMEVVYTAAALMNSFVAAHWLHTLTLVGLGLSAVGIAQTLGVRSLVPLAGAVMVSPVVWIQSFAAYNDTAAASFTVAAVATLMSGRYSWGATVLSSALLVVGVSIKPTSVIAVGVLGIIALLSGWWRLGPVSLGRAVKVTGALALVGVCTVAFWSVRQYMYTGFLLDPAMTAEPDAYARTMLPEGSDWVVMPFLPLISGVIGSVEPWGGRTSLIMQVLLLPTAVWALWRRGTVLARYAMLFIAAYAHWIVLGIAIVRTRFHILSWTLLLVAIFVAVDALVAEQPRAQRLVRWGWLVLIALSLADVMRQTLSTIAMI